MASTSPNELAHALRDACLQSAHIDEGLVDQLAAQALAADPNTAAPATSALFSSLIEPLADLFEPRLCDAYSRLFSRILERAFPDQLNAAALLDRYQHVRRVRPVDFEPARVVVLSRVTLGADVAITSMVLDAAKQRFPNARILFAGPVKAWQLFERDPRLEHLSLNYGRTSLLRDRLAIFPELQSELSRPGTLVLDPDSRLTQLGLLPVCPPERHHLFESRSYGGESLESLSTLTAAWLAETLGVEEPIPYLHPKYHYDFGSNPVLTASLGVGENPAKRLPDPFEARMVQAFAALPAQVFIDKGAPGSEETRRVESAIASCGRSKDRLGVHDGAFASFAAMIAASSCYFGYDSAGQHVAAALGVPLVAVFNGFASARMLARWTPDGPGPMTILRADGFESLDTLISHATQAVSEYTVAV